MKKKINVGLSIALAVSWLAPPASALDQAYPSAPYYQYVAVNPACKTVDNPVTVGPQAYYLLSCTVRGGIYLPNSYGGAWSANATIYGSCSVFWLVFGDSDWSIGRQPNTIYPDGEESFIKAMAFASISDGQNLSSFQACYPDRSCVDNGEQLVIC